MIDSGIRQRYRIHLAQALSIVVMSASFAAFAQTPENDYAVVLIYHHVSNNTPESTSVTPEEFDAHLAFLANNNYTVMPLAEIVDALVNKTPLPERAVALTFDDGYESVYEVAMPRLRKRGWPFTVFVSIEAIDRGQSPYLNWQHLRELTNDGATIANHSMQHDHLIRRHDGESDTAWRRRVRSDILEAQRRLEHEIGPAPKIFAYPYGEFDYDLKELVRELGYVAFGQQSGPVAWSSDAQELPRFPVASAFADIDALADKLRSRPVPATVLSPDDGVLTSGPRRPELRLEIPDGPYRRNELACYVAGQPAATVTWDNDVAIIQSQGPLDAGRSKYNCTMPSSTDNGIFHWYSYLWMKPNADGSWYVE